MGSAGSKEPAYYNQELANIIKDAAAYRAKIKQVKGVSPNMDMKNIEVSVALQVMAIKAKIEKDTKDYLRKAESLLEKAEKNGIKEINFRVESYSRSNILEEQTVRGEPGQLLLDDFFASLIIDFDPLQWLAGVATA